MYALKPFRKPFPISPLPTCSCSDLLYYLPYDVQCPTPHTHNLRAILAPESNSALSQPVNMLTESVACWWPGKKTATNLLKEPSHGRPRLLCLWLDCAVKHFERISIFRQLFHLPLSCLAIKVSAVLWARNHLTVNISDVIKRVCNPDMIQQDLDVWQKEINVSMYSIVTVLSLLKVGPEWARGQGRNPLQCVT